MAQPYVYVFDIILLFTRLCLVDLIMIHQSIAICFLSLEYIIGSKSLATYAVGHFHVFSVVQAKERRKRKKARTDTQYTARGLCTCTLYNPTCSSLPQMCLQSRVTAVTCNTCRVAMSVQILHALGLQIILNFSAFYKGRKAGNLQIQSYYQDPEWGFDCQQKFPLQGFQNGSDTHSATQGKAATA